MYDSIQKDIDKEEQAKKKILRKAQPDWVIKMQERKRQFILDEVARTKRHLADQKERRKRREQAKKLKKEGKKKQKRLQSKYHKSDVLRKQQEEAEKKHKKLFALMAFTVDKLSPGIMYRVRVAAINNTGQGPFSTGCFSTFTLSQAPERGDPPHLLGAELDSMLIEWTTPHDNGAAITAFMLRQCYDGVEHEFKRTVQRIVVENLQPGKGYKFQIKSANSEGWSEWSKESEPLRTLTKEPVVPEKPVVVGKTCTSITFKVRKPKDNGDAITHYIVRKREMSVKRKTAWNPAGTFHTTLENLEHQEEIEDIHPPHGKIIATFATISIESLGPASHYDFQVACKNNSGTSNFSTSTFRTKTLPAQKPGQVPKVWTTNVGPTSLMLNWEEPPDNGGRILGYNIEEFAREFDGMPAKDEHKEEYSCGIVTRKRVDALESSCAYRFRIAARNHVGVGAFSDFSERVESVQNDPGRLDGGSGAAGTGGLAKFQAKGLGDGGGSDSDEADGEEEKKAQVE